MSIPNLTKKELAVFRSRVVKTGRCWVWVGNVFSTQRAPNYFIAYFRDNGVTLRAARVSLQLQTGNDGYGLCALHKCGNSLCVRPGHLYWGTQKENVIDSVRGPSVGSRSTKPTIQRIRSKFVTEPGRQLLRERAREARFEANIKKTASCWLWMGGRLPSGYGKVTRTEQGKTTTILAHRFSWSVYNKMGVPHGMWVLHKCDNPPCVNPKHLHLGTAKENTLDMLAKGRHWVRNGELHPCARLSSAQVKEIRIAHRNLSKTSNSWRACNVLSGKYSVRPLHIWKIVNYRVRKAA